MREAMARAEVGDDVFGDDPTVLELQRRVARLLGKQAALFVPSGTQANQIALLLHARAGDEVLVGEGAHQMVYEAGAGGAIAGVQFAVLGAGGMFDAADVEEAIKPLDSQLPPARLVSVEDTHNRSGGRVWPLERLRAVAEAAKSVGLALHLDGARLLNAAVASGVPAKDRAAPFDTVSLCLSKGLGAPVGSLLAGSAELIERAHRYRRMLGGGMRQVGILAAAGLYALEHNVERLAEDHDERAPLRGDRARAARPRGERRHRDEHRDDRPRAAGALAARGVRAPVRRGGAPHARRKEAAARGDPPRRGSRRVRASGRDPGRGSSALGKHRRWGSGDP